jgi:hypothetical protein
MKLITIRAFAEPEDDNYEQVFITIAPDAETALSLVTEQVGQDGPWKRYEPGEVVEGTFDPPARVLGYCGQGAWSWRR